MAKKVYQVWALLRGENGTERWQAVTRKYAVKKSAQNIARELWLETKIDESEEEEDEPGESSLTENFENRQYEGA